MPDADHPLARRARECADACTGFQLMKVEPARQLLFDLAAEVERQREEIGCLNAKWRVYEREYILPLFDWATDLGFDLRKLVHENAGKNCARLFYEYLKEKVERQAAEIQMLQEEIASMVNVDEGE